MELKGKTALVTGGGIRLGRAIVIELARQGCNLAIHYNRSVEDARRVQEKAQKAGVRADIFQFNLENFGNINELFDEVNRSLGMVDILINNAGSYKRGSGMAKSQKNLEAMFNLNLFAPWWLIKEFVNQLDENSQGRIVNICDAGIFKTASDHFAYRLTKKALFELTRMFALELAPRITVNAVAPGIMLPLSGYEHVNMDEVAERKIPLNRIGSPEIVAENVLHILRQDFMTGSIIKVDGGENIV